MNNENDNLPDSFEDNLDPEFEDDWLEFCDRMAWASRDERGRFRSDTEIYAIVSEEERQERQTVTIAASMAFNTYPDGHEDDTEWLFQNNDGAAYALTLEDLPHGGWGDAVEFLRMVTVPADSPEADSAINNTNIERGQL